MTNEVAKATLADPTSAALAAGKSLLADGIVYESDGVNWDAVTTGDFTSETVPTDLTAGQLVNIDGKVAMSDSEDLLNISVDESLIRHTQTRLNNFYLTTASSATSGTTRNIAIAMEARFNRVRALYANNTDVVTNLGPIAVTVRSAIAGIAESRNNDATPLPVTVAGATTVAMAARPSATVPRFYWTDWANISSVARPAGNTHPYLIWRDFAAGSQTMTVTSNDSQSWSGLSREKWTTGTGTGNFVDTNYATYNGGQNANQTYAVGFQADAPDGCINIANVGDSVFAGYGAGVSIFGNSWFYRSVVGISTDKLPVNHINMGWTGQTSDKFLARFKALVADLDLSIAIFQTYSTNDGSPTAALISAAKGRVADFLATCTTNRVVPVLWTPLVSSLWTPEQKALMAAYRDEVRSYKNVHIIDAASVLIDPATNDFIAGVSDDSVHLNETGIALATPVAQAVVRKALKNGSRVTL